MSSVAKRTPLIEVCETIASSDFGQKIAQALPPNVTLDRFTRVTLTAIQTNPALITADRASLYSSVIRCAQDGLIPDGREAALVIFKVKGIEKIQYLPMIAGLRKKAAEHSFGLSAYCVYQEDDFDYTLGIDPSITHKPPKLGTDRGEIIGAYAVATDMRTGERYVEVMARSEIEEVRKVSRAATSEYGPWVNWYGEQCRKTVARRLFKQLPLGAIDESTSRMLASADSEFDHGGPAPMSVEEANLSAGLLTSTTPPDEPPDDEAPELVEGEIVESAEASFAERADQAQRTRAAKATT